nr:hypothetical protein [Abalone asfa-like virus]
MASVEYLNSLDKCSNQQFLPDLTYCEWYATVGKRDFQDLKELLEILRRDLPKVVVRIGTESDYRFYFNLSTGVFGPGKKCDFIFTVAGEKTNLHELMKDNIDKFVPLYSTIVCNTKNQNDWEFNSFKPPLNSMYKSLDWGQEFIRITQFIEKVIIQGDEERRDLVYRYLKGIFTANPIGTALFLHSDVHGAGKSTLANIITAALAPNSGMFIEFNQMLSVFGELYRRFFVHIENRREDDAEIVLSKPENLMVLNALINLPAYYRELPSKVVPQNNLSVMITSNTIPPKTSNARFIETIHYITISPMFAGNDTYWNELYKDIHNPDCMAAFTKWVCSYGTH